jgi:hypothetical protein
MDFTLREQYWIKFYKKLIAVIFYDNYYSQFCMYILKAEYFFLSDLQLYRKRDFVEIC